MRKLLIIAGFVASLPLCASPILIDWTTGAPNANQGLSMTSGALTITARTGMTGSYDPLFGGGSPGTIYWGDLGKLDDDTDCGGKNSPACIGLGVQTADVDKSGNLKPAGSKGISGDGGDADEALVFSWAGGIPADQLHILLVGLNGPDSKGKNGDVVWLFLEWYPSNGSGSDLTVLPYDISGILNAPSWLDVGSIAGTSGKTLASIAVTSREGHFGVGAIQWNEQVIPEPATILLSGLGLSLLALYRRHRQA